MTGGGKNKVHSTECKVLYTQYFVLCTLYFFEGALTIYTHIARIDCLLNRENSGSVGYYFLLNGGLRISTEFDPREQIEKIELKINGSVISRFE